MLLVEMLTSALSFSNGLQQQLILRSDSPAQPIQGAALYVDYCVLLIQQVHEYVYALLQWPM